MALFFVSGLFCCFREERTMSAGRFGFETTPPPDPAPEQRREAEPHAAVRAAPDTGEDDQRGAEPDDEPGYGHGV
jgi:hypothetical protein